jgi:hypothetical protein
MNAPTNIDPVTAHSDYDVVHWLTNDTRDERFIDNIFAELCVRLQRAGIPVKRLETLTKQLGRTVLLSRSFVDFVKSDFDFERVGEYPVRGFNDPIELFAYHG